MHIKNILSRALLLLSLVFSTGLGNLIYSQSFVLSELSHGTGSTSSLPVLGNYGYSYSQMIYFKSDMNERIQDINSHITKIRLYYSSGSVNQSKDWVIYMGHTAIDNFATNTSWIPLTNLTQVFSGDISGLTAAEGGWFEIELQTPFTYNGISNLVLAVDENTPGFSNLSFRQHSGTSANRSILYRNDSNNPNPNLLPTASARFEYVPQTIFVHEPAALCSGMPIHSDITINPSSICPGETSTIKYIQPGFSGGLEYVWQQYDGISWVSIDTTINPEIAITEHTAITSRYRVRVTCTTSGQTDISEEATLVVSASPEVSVNNTELVVCDGESANLTASGADTYKWSPSTGLDNTNTSSTNATITDNIVYYVIGANESGCKDSASVNLRLLSKYKLVADVISEETCSHGNNVTLQVENTVLLNNNGQWQYRFSDANNTTLQDWSENNTISFTPDTDSVYVIYYQYASGICPDIVPDSIKKEIVIGFGSKIRLTDYDCINKGGSIHLYDYFGQNTESILYQNALATDNPDIDLRGVATYNDNRLALTPSATSSNGSAVVTIPQTGLSSGSIMTIEFDLTADQIINNYGTGGADGIAYSFGNDVGHTNTAHYGSGSKLRICFDAADNQSNARGIYLIYGKNNTSAPSPGEVSTLAFSPNTSLWKGLTNVPIRITIKKGTLTLTVDETIIFENIALPESFMEEDISTWQHSFGAQTGGDAMRQAVSGLKISNSAIDFGISQDTNPPLNWDINNSFEDLSPGIYHIWMAKPETSCRKNIGSVIINNVTPHVNLGNDTTICEGEQMVLDAQNPGTSYIWGNSNNTGRTLIVSEAGTYSVQVMDSNGCMAIDAITIGVQPAPSAEDIEVRSLGLTALFTLSSAKNTSFVDWDFGDGNSVSDGPASVFHTYQSSAQDSYTVTATAHNQCDSTTYSITYTNTIAGVNKNITGLNVYPNPVKDVLMISMEDPEPATISLIDAQGRKIVENLSFVSTTAINITDYETGMYFLNITSGTKNSVLKIFIQ